MKIKKIITSALIGTSAMTLYSYIQSREKSKDFREPRLLTSLINRGSESTNVPKSSGWILHYAVGTGFTSIYHILWNQTIRPSLVSGVLLGAVNGAVGVVVWSTAMKVHPAPPRIDRKSFYRHLLSAHMVFGTFVALSSKYT